MKNTLLFLLLICILSACQKRIDFDTDTSEFNLADPSLSIHTIAAEPLLEAPVALDMDAVGNIWVVELPGYMRDLDGSDEKKPDGKIVKLSDTDQDGRMDTRTVMVDGLETPRTLLLIYGGLLYSNGSSLLFSTIKNDIVASPTVVDSLYVIGGNIEHQPNGLLYNIDNWIYSAKSSVRYKKEGDKCLKEATTFRGQWGISADSYGRLYHNHNSLPLAADFAAPNQLLGNPYQKLSYGVDEAISPNNKIYPIQATAVNRGYQEGVLDSLGKVTEVTSACGPLVYAGNAIGDTYKNAAFFCAPEGNLVKSYSLSEKDGRIRAETMFDQKEFLVSKEESFRPVNAYQAPNGSLLVLDMRKGVIQHRAYMTDYLREKLLKRGLDTIVGKGRVYQINRFEKARIANNFENVTPHALVDMLSDQLYAVRIKAQKLLISKKDTSVQDALSGLATSKNHLAKLHAIYTLQGLQLLDIEAWQAFIKDAEHPQLIAHLIHLSSAFDQGDKDILQAFQKFESRKEAPIKWALAKRLPSLNLKAADDWLEKLIQENGNEPIFCESLISGISGKEETILSTLASKNDSLTHFLTKVIQHKKAGEIQAPQIPKKLFKDTRTAGLDLYSTYCASCHGLDGKGKEKLAPRLTNSDYVSGSKDRLVLITLQGLNGPIYLDDKEVNFAASMPGIKNNSTLSNKDISDLLTFLRNSFTEVDAYVAPERIERWRDSLQNQETLFTHESLNQRLEL